MNIIEGVYIVALVVCFAGSGACITSGTIVPSSTVYPYQAAILCPWLMCNGAIVSSKNVLTTATCVSSIAHIAQADLRVTAGSLHYSIDAVEYLVERIVQHPSYLKSNNDANLAIFTIATPFDFSFSSIQPIPLATTIPAISTDCIATGHGPYKFYGDYATLPEVLQMAKFKLYDRTFCQKYHGKPITATMFCAGDLEGNRDLCLEDEGAPLAFNGKLIGIYSWGCKCGTSAPNPSAPVFSAIPSFVDWIEANIVP